MKEIKASESQVPTRHGDPAEKSIEERLNTLKELYDNGTIDKETYETQRQRILESI